MRPSPAPVRSRTRGARTGTGPRPVRIARSGRCPWRTSRWRPSSVCLSAWPLRKAATSASTACANRARAPSRRTSVSGSENAAGWISLTTLSWIMAYHSFGGEVEVSNTPTIRRLNPSRRHQLPRIPRQPTGVSSVREGAGPTAELARLQRAAAQKALEVTGLGLPRDHPVCDLADRIALRAVAGEHQLAVEVEDHHRFRPGAVDWGAPSVNYSRRRSATDEPGLATGRISGRVTDQSCEPNCPEPFHAREPGVNTA